jgi:hypothetical protein
MFPPFISAAKREPSADDAIALQLFDPGGSPWSVHVTPLSVETKISPGPSTAASIEPSSDEARLVQFKEPAELW